MPHSHHVPMHSHACIQGPWNTCTLTTTQLHPSSLGQSPPHLHIHAFIEGCSQCQSPPIQVQRFLRCMDSQCHAYSRLLPPLPPSLGRSKNGTKAQRPLLASSPSLLPSPLASGPFVLLQLRQSGSPGRAARTVERDCRVPAAGQTGGVGARAAAQSTRVRAWPGKFQVHPGT